MTANQPTNQPELHLINQSINQSTRPPDLINPKGPHDGQRVRTEPVGFGIPITASWKKIRAHLRLLAARDGASFAWVCREALYEYHERHYPGNPTVPLDHWTKGEPLSEAAQEKLTPKTGPKTQQCEECKGTGVDKRDGRSCSGCGGHGVVYLE